MGFVFFTNLFGILDFYQYKHVLIYTRRTESKLFMKNSLCFEL